MVSSPVPEYSVHTGYLFVGEWPRFASTTMNLRGRVSQREREAANNGSGLLSQPTSGVMTPFVRPFLPSFLPSFLLPLCLLPLDLPPPRCSFSRSPRRSLAANFGTRLVCRDRNHARFGLSDASRFEGIRGEDGTERERDRERECTWREKGETGITCL